jgi:hypothetical protein
MLPAAAILMKLRRVLDLSVMCAPASFHASDWFVNNFNKVDRLAENCG